MKRFAIAAALALLAGTLPTTQSYAASPASTLTMDGKRITLDDSYAYLGSDPSGHGHCPVVVLADGALDKAALNAAADPWDELRRQQNGKLHTFVMLHLRNDGRAQIDVVGDQPLYHGLSNSSAVLSLEQRNDRHVAGSYVSKNAADAARSASHIVWDLHFAADIARSVDEAPHAVSVSHGAEPDEEEAPPPPPPPPSPGKSR